MKDTMRPEASPALLPRAPRGAPGTNRLNRRPIWIAAAGVGLVVIAIGYTYSARLAATKAAAEHETREAEPADGSSILAQAPLTGVIQSAARAPVAPRLRPPSQPAVAAPPSDSASQADELRDHARREAWRTYYAELAEVRKARLTAMTSALSAQTAVNTSGTAPGSGTPVEQRVPASGESTPVATTGGVAGPSAMASFSGVGLPGSPMFAPPAQIDASGAREKQAFMARQGDTSGLSDTLMTTVRNPISPYLITAGDYIPCVAVGGENSDAPGLFVGRVTQNVYDSATGRYLLVPQGAKVIGVYDNVVSAGQSRIPTAVTRIIFPDSSSIDIGSMPAADQSGFAGLHDQVNTHWWAKFGNALILGVAGAGAQLSQPQAVNGQNYNSQQVATAALGQQFAELGSETARAGLAIPNTLQIRPGYRFTIQVTKDMVLRPYIDYRTDETSQPVSLGPVLQ